MRRKIIATILILTMAVATTGCVKVIKTGTEGQYTGKESFNAGDNVSKIWDKAVDNISEKAIDLPTFLTEAKGNMSSLADKYGKYSMGTSGTISYAVKGTGTVSEVENTKKAGYMTVKLDGYDGAEVIKIQIGSIYKGSSTRDTLDIIDFGDYTNQNEWGAVSTSLHELIDKNVIKPADPASLNGKSIEFTGTFTANGNDELLITPVVLKAK